MFPGECIFGDGVCYYICYIYVIYVSILVCVLENFGVLVCLGGSWGFVENVGVFSNLYVAG